MNKKSNKKTTKHIIMNILRTACKPMFFYFNSMKSNVIDVIIDGVSLPLKNKYVFL